MAVLTLWEAHSLLSITYYWTGFISTSGQQALLIRFLPEKFPVVVDDKLPIA
jgi:hypothetical protein